MCEPTTIAAVAIGGATVAGGVLKGQAAQAAANANASTLESNAQLAELGASDALVRGEQTAGKVRMEGDQVASAQTAEFAASGVDVKSGSVSDVVGSTAAISELDAQIAKSNARREAFGLTTQAKNFRRQARNVRAQGSAALTADILGGVIGGAGAALPMLHFGGPAGGGDYLSGDMFGGASYT